MTSVTKRLLAAVMAAILMLAVLAVPAFAETTEAAVAEETEAAVGSTADDAAEETDADDASEDLTTVSNDTETDTTESKEINWDLWISVGIIVIAGLVFLGFYLFNKKFKERVKQFCRDYKSELKKVVWSPVSDVKRNTIVVIVISLGSALLIGVLDYVFSKGIIALGQLIG